MDRIKYRMTGSSILDKFSSLKGTDRRRKGSRGRIDTCQSLEELNRIQTFISKMPDHEANTKFEQMLDDMNLSEENKAPLRLRTVEQKRSMLSMQYKGSVRSTKGPANDFINELKRVPKMKGGERYEVVSSLRVALTNNTVSWMQDFGKKQGLNSVLKCLSYSCDDWEERRSTLECVRCLRAYSNNKFGLKQLIEHKDATTLLMRCIDPPTPPPSPSSSSSSSSSSYRSSSLQTSSLLSYSKTSLSKAPSSSSSSSPNQVSFEAVKLLAALSLVPPDGLSKVLEGASICAEMRGRPRFGSVVEGLSSTDFQMKLACMQLVNAMVSTPDDLDLRLHLRNEVSRTGLCDVIGSLEQHSNEEMQRQVRVWLDDQEEDAEEFSHRYENVRIHMDDPKECFQVLLQSTLNTPSEDCFLSILQHLLSIREDQFARPHYYELIEECVSQIVLHRSGIDPDFRCSRRFQLDLELLLGKIRDNDVTLGGDGDGGEGGGRDTMKTRLDEVTMAKHELEASNAAYKEKIKIYEAEIIELRTKLNMDISTIISSAIKLAPSTTPVDSTIPPPPPLPGLGPLPPGSIPIPPPPLGANMMMMMKPRVPSFVKPKKKYNPSNQMKRANWVKINLEELKRESFWSRAHEEEYEDDLLFEQLLNHFAFKNIEKKDDIDSDKQYKKAKELKILDAKSAQNLSILLGSLKLPHEEIKHRILSIDHTNLTPTFLDQLLKLLPTQDIINKLGGLKEQYDSLTEPEQFGVVISSIRRLLPRLSSMLFKMQFEEMLNETKPEIMSATVAMEEVVGSKAFGEVLKIILLFGNFMNAGSRNECTIGFELSFIPKIVNTKSRDNSKSLMTFLVEYLQHKHPRLLSFVHDLIHLEQASKVSPDSLTKTISGMKMSVKQLETDLTNARNDKQAPMPDDAFVSVMTPFLEQSKEQVSLLEGMHKGMMSKYTKEVAPYFCLDPCKYMLDDLLSDLQLFVEQFQQSCKEIERQREIEGQQKRQKEMERRLKEERRMKKMRKKMLVDIHADDDQEGVMDNLLEALKTGSAFHVGKRQVRKRNSRVAGAERRAQLVHTRSRQGILSPPSQQQQQPSLTIRPPTHLPSHTSPTYKSPSANKTSKTSPLYKPSSAYKLSKQNSINKESPGQHATTQRQMNTKSPLKPSQQAHTKSPIHKTSPRNHPQTLTIKKHSPLHNKSSLKQHQQLLNSFPYKQQHNKYSPQQQQNKSNNSRREKKDGNIRKIVFHDSDDDENDKNVNNYTIVSYKGSATHKKNTNLNHSSKSKEESNKASKSKEESNKASKSKEESNKASKSKEESNKASNRVNKKSPSTKASNQPHTSSSPPSHSSSPPPPSSSPPPTNNEDLFNSFSTGNSGDFEDLLSQLRAL